MGRNASLAKSLPDRERRAAGAIAGGGDLHATQARCGGGAHPPSSHPRAPPRGGGGGGRGLSLPSLPACSVPTSGRRGFHGARARRTGGSLLHQPSNSSSILAGAVRSRAPRASFPHCQGLLPSLDPVAIGPSSL